MNEKCKDCEALRTNGIISALIAKECEVKDRSEFCPTVWYSKPENKSISQEYIFNKYEIN